MKNQISIQQEETANWLFKSDHHYLASRLLYLHGLLFAAEENAAFALELLLKTYLKASNISFKQNHKLTELWPLAKLPLTLDEGYLNYLRKLEDALYSKHADMWKQGRKTNDRVDDIDLLYLKTRKHVVKIMNDTSRIQTELDLAKNGSQMFTNYQDRHGSWTLATVLKRSNNRYDLL